jgi:secretion/DNA translocation related CpaE-like protein
VTEPRPLLVTNDPDLLDDLLRLAAAADVEVDVAVDPIAARARWAAAPLILVGTDLVTSAAMTGNPSRLGVLLVCRAALDEGLAAQATAAGAEAVLQLPDADDHIVERLASCAADPAADACVVGILGGCGGAGASVLAAAMATTAARRHEPALLIDVDPLGGGLDLLLGIEETPGSRWSELTGVSGRLAPAALREALPITHGLAVLSHGRRAGPVPPDEALCAVVDAGRRGGGVVVLDLPRYLPSGAAAAAMADEVVLVVPADVRAASSAVQVAAGLSESARSLGVVVRRPGGATLSAEAVADVVALPLLGETRAEPGLAALLCGGQPMRIRRRGPLSTLSNQLLDRWLVARKEVAA